MLWLRRNAYFRAEEWLASLAARKTQYNVHFVDIIPWPQAAMLWLRRDAYFRAEEWLAYAHCAKDAV